MEGMAALCCGLPALIGLAILYATAPPLRKGILVLCGLGGLLLALGIGYSIYDEARNEPVVSALDDRDPVALRRALDAGGSANADVGADDSFPVLFKAIEYDDAASVEVLLQRGADPNARGSGLTALEAALGKAKIVRLLKRYGAR